MAGKYLGPAFDIHGGGVDLRFPHHENEQAQSRAAGRPFASYWLHNAWITTAGEKMSKSLGNSLLIPAVLERVRGIELRYYMVAAHYRSHVEFSFEALDEAAKGFRRIEDFLDRAAPVVGALVRGDARRVHRGPWTTTSARPAAVAVIHDSVREGNRLLADGPSDALSQKFGEVIAMLDVLGLNPADEAWATRGADDKLHRRRRRAGAGTAGRADGGARGQGLGPRRRDPRPDQAAAGIEVEDTPTGPKWSV